MKIDSQAIPDFVTLANGFVGLLAIMYIIDGEFRYGMVLILVGILIDGVDGILARFFNRDKRHGVYLDSIADMVTFCFAPSILIYSKFYDLSLGSSFESPENALTVTASMLVVLCGILRLARFIERGHKNKNYVGLPTPAAAVFIVMSMEVLSNQFTVLICAILVSMLMISKIEYPKLRGVLGCISGAVIILGILAIWFSDMIFDYISILVLVLAIVYVVIGPLYAVRFKGDVNEQG
jgi:CDP-diacylglycerol--serine O-phosphatidyltransferase